MERKNTMLLTVIAVATLLVAVVGATFAYYSVTGDRTYNTTNVQTTTGKIGTVTYTGEENNLFLNVTTEQMSQVSQGTYYSTTDSEKAALTKTDHKIGTFRLTGANKGDEYKCTFNIGITVTDHSAASQLNSLTDAESEIYINTENGVTYTGFASPYKTKAVAGTAVNASGSVILVAGQDGTKTTEITGYQTFVNTAEDQNNLAELNLATAINITNVVCDTNGTARP